MPIEHRLTMVGRGIPQEGSCLCGYWYVISSSETLIKMSHEYHLRDVAEAQKDN